MLDIFCILINHCSHVETHMKQKVRDANDREERNRENTQFIGEFFSHGSACYVQVMQTSVTNNPAFSISIILAILVLLLKVEKHS